MVQGARRLASRGVSRGRKMTTALGGAPARDARSWHACSGVELDRRAIRREFFPRIANSGAVFGP